MRTLSINLLRPALVGWALLLFPSFAAADAFSSGGGGLSSLQSGTTSISGGTTGTVCYKDSGGALSCDSFISDDGTRAGITDTADWDGGGDLSKGIFHLENTNAGSTGGMLSIADVCAGSSGSCFEIRLDGNNPDIEFIEDDANPTYTGKYELAVQGQFFQFNARNAADTSFATLARFLGGTFNDGGSAPTGNQNVTRLELFGSPDLAASSHRDSLRLRFTAKYDNAGAWSDANVWDLFSDQTGTSASNNTFKLMDHSGNVVLSSAQGAANVDAASGLKIGGGTEITGHLSASASLDFANQASAGCEELSITVTGAADGNVCSVGVPNAANVAGSFFTCRVSAANTVQVKHCTVSSGNPASGTFRVAVSQY